LVDNAIDGDTTAVRECFDRMDGKVTQSVDAIGHVRRRKINSALASCSRELGGVRIMGTS
jgi:hypothetical protein